MKTILFFRHAKSNLPGVGGDRARTLNARGRHDASHMGRLLLEQDLVPDLIMCSTANRAKETALIAAQHCGCERDIEFHEDIYESSPEKLINILSSTDDQHTRVMIVGHNPDLEDIIQDITGVAIRMSTANIAQVTMTIDSWREMNSGEHGRLARVWQPADNPS